MSQKGFTLIELMVVIVIIGILSALAVPKMFGVSAKAKAAQYLEPITLAPGVPDHIRTFCATLLQKGGGYRVALSFLVDRYVRSGNAINREIFLKKIMALYPPPMPETEARRADTVQKILHEIELEPKVTMMGLGLIHEFLTGSLSPQSQQLLDALFK